MMRINRKWLKRTEQQHKEAMKSWNFRIWHIMNVEDGLTICKFNHKY